jgi:ubiquinone biosynthesis protein
VLGSLLEMKEFVGSLPTRLNKILDAIADAELEVRVRPTDVTPFLESFQKIANRITTGLILSALIIGASLLMDVQTPFTIFGYPGVAMIFFFVAAVGGLALVANILLHDYNKRRKPPAR